MALLRILDDTRTLTDADAIRDVLAPVGIAYERTGAAPGPSPDSSSDAILATWAPKIEELESAGGDVVADIIPVTPESGADTNFQPLCFGPAHVPAARVTPGVSV